MALTGDTSLIIDGYEITCRQSDGYVNATALCKAGGKLFKNWNANKGSKDFIDELSEVLQARDPLIKSITTGPNRSRGTWVHPQIAIKIAQDISVRFAVSISLWISSLGLRISDQMERIEALERQLSHLTVRAEMANDIDALHAEVASLRLLLEKKESETLNRGEIYSIECSACGCVYIGSSTDSQRRYQEHLRDFTVKDSFAEHMRLHGSMAMKLATVEAVTYRDRAELLGHEQEKLDATIALLGRDRVINKNNPVRKGRRS